MRKMENIRECEEVKNKTASLMV